MDKKKEIEEMAKVMYRHYCKDDKCGECKQPNCLEYRRAVRLYNAGYGNVKQAVKEFAENAVKPIIDELVELLFDHEDGTCMVGTCHKISDIPCGSSICIEENKLHWKNKIDDIVKGLYGEE